MRGPTIGATTPGSPSSQASASATPTPPAHGPAVTDPKQLVRGMIGHRRQRGGQVGQQVGEIGRGEVNQVAGERLLFGEGLAVDHALLRQREVAVALGGDANRSP